MLPVKAAPSLGRVKLFETRPRRNGGGAWTLAGQRLAELELLIGFRFGPRGVDTDDWGVIAAIGLNHLVAHVRLLPAREDRPSDVELCRGWIARFCPAADPVAIERLIAAVLRSPRRYRADTIAKLLNVTDAERRALGLRTIGATDRDAEARKADRREADRARKRAARRAAARPRKPTLAEQRPWAALGMSRATWYRKGKPMPANPAPIRETKSVRNISYRGYYVPPHIADAKNLTSHDASRIALAARQFAGRIAPFPPIASRYARALRAIGRIAAALQERPHAA